MDCIDLVFPDKVNDLMSMRVAEDCEGEKTGYDDDKWDRHLIRQHR